MDQYSNQKNTALTIVNTYAPNIGASIYIKQILADKGRDDSNYGNSRGHEHPTFING